MSETLLQRGQYEKGGIGRWYWDYRDRQVLADIPNDGVILDLGCGEGITLERIRQKLPGRKIWGTDYSLEKARTCAQFRLPVHCSSVYALGFKEQSVDGCLFLEVIEHLESPEKALKEIHRVLKTKGVLLLIFPNDFTFKLARLTFFKFKEAFAPSGHVKQWTPGRMQALLTRSDFEIERAYNLPFYFWWSSLHCLIVARKKN